MLYLAKLTVQNFKCYRGEHELVLEPKVYAVTARMENDAERSNWLGKSSLLEAIGFVLFGRHHELTHDAIITRGEKWVEVAAELSNGATIKRRREIGKSTKLWYFAAGTRAGAMQDEAQKLIEELIGLGEADFVRTCFFEQKKLSEFITMRAGDRMEVITEWLRLSPLEDCEAHLSAKISEGLTAIDQYDKLLFSHKQTIAETPDVDKVRIRLETVNNEIAGRKERLDEIRDQEKEAEEQRSIIEKAAKFDQLVEEGKKLKAEIDEIDNGSDEFGTIEEEHDHLKSLNQDAEVDVRKAKEEVKKLSVLSKGEFDGKCPVANIKCPARDTINSMNEENTALLRQAKEVLDQAQADSDDAYGNLDAFEDNMKEHAAKKHRLEAIRSRCEEYQDAKKKSKKLKPADRDAIRSRFDSVQGALLEAQSEAERLRLQIKRHDEANERFDILSKERETASERIALLREAMVIFGKNGAQRRVAEGALSAIEHGANEMLAQCGIPLDVTVQWAREGSGLATVCESCGSPFPPSTKVRTCTRCGVDRGPKMVNKLDIVLSARSGAAEDLAGASLQLSASSWLRNDRESTWGTALIDEPFGSLDTALRREFASHLTSMLSTGHGFRQAFVIAHHASVLDALPGRILISSNGKHSVPKVVA